jgi:TorA maturation chaperone TorD
MIDDSYQYGRLLNLLSSILLCQPTQELLKGWRDLLVYEPIPEASELAEVLEVIDLANPEVCDRLLWDYTRLFIGPYHLPCPPYESVYTTPEKLLLQDATQEVQSLYLRAGIEVTTEHFMPDHVGVELGFLAALVERAASNPDLAIRYAGLAETFLEAHVRAWVPRFASDLEAAAETPFYQALARLLKLVVEQGWPIPSGGALQE